MSLSRSFIDVLKSRLRQVLRGKMRSAASMSTGWLESFLRPDVSTATVKEWSQPVSDTEEEGKSERKGR